MSLSHPNVISVKKRFKAEADGLPCPECGKETLTWQTGDCILHDGTVIPDLERIQCSFCGEYLFDVHAMKQIREYLESQSNRKSVRKPKLEKTNA